MRTMAKQQSALWNPLNDIFGRETHVRILRVLCLEQIPISRPDLARSAQIQLSGIHRVVDQLEDMGIIETVGRGRQQSLRLRQQHVLAGPMRTLFAEERTRARRAMDLVSQAVHSMVPPPRAAWIEGPVATQTDTEGDPIIVGVLIDATTSSNQTDSLREQLTRAQGVVDVVVELRLRREPDLATMTEDERAPLRNVRPIIGPPPLDVIDPPTSTSTGPTSRSHAEADEKSLRIAAILANRIRRDPTLIDRAKEYIERRVPGASSGERLELIEWQSILTTMSSPRLRRFLIDTRERATRLRQSLPFLPILTDAERTSIRDEVDGAGLS
jgi:hypothetical protein